MRSTAFRRGATAAVVALLMAAGEIAFAGSAHADDKDDKFIEQLDWQHVPYESRTEAIRAAKRFCLTSSRQSTPRWRAIAQLSVDMDWTATETQAFVKAATPTYCR